MSDVSGVLSGGRALSPSRALDFRQCPLLFRLRTIDRLPERESVAAVRGTVVHSVLERLFDVPPDERDVGFATSLVDGVVQELVESRPAVKAEFDVATIEGVVTDARALVARYFELENPQMLHPAAREVTLSSYVGRRSVTGVVDRVDVAPDGAIRLVDYKSGRAPAPQYSGNAAFQMRFYALLVARVKGRLPAMLRLVYLGDGKIMESAPTNGDVSWVEASIARVWDGIERAIDTDGFVPRRSKLCWWCSFQQVCPAFGGSVGPVDRERASQVWLGVPGELSRSEEVDGCAVHDNVEN